MIVILSLDFLKGKGLRSGSVLMTWLEVPSCWSCLWGRPRNERNRNICFSWWLLPLKHVFHRGNQKNGFSFPWLCEIQKSSTNFSEHLGSWLDTTVTVLLLFKTCIRLLHESSFLLWWKPGQVCVLRHGVVAEALTQSWKIYVQALYLPSPDRWP